MIGNRVALAGISQNKEINNDAIFLDRMQKMLYEFERSKLFLQFRNCLVTTFHNTRQAVKKRIGDESQ